MSRILVLRPSVVDTSFLKTGIFTITSDPLPNIRGRKSSYLLPILPDYQSRIYHIVSTTQTQDTIILGLGNSFVFPSNNSSIPYLTTEFAYISVEDLGLHELQPGLLINVGRK